MVSFVGVENFGYKSTKSNAKKKVSKAVLLTRKSMRKMKRREVWWTGKRHTIDKNDSHRLY